MGKDSPLTRLPVIGISPHCPATEAHLPGTIISLCTGFVENQAEHFKRRRSSYRLASFFKLKMNVSIIGLFLFIYFPFRMHTGFGPDNMLDECVQSSNTIVDGEALKFYTRDPPFVDAQSFWTFARYFRKTWQCEKTGFGGVSTVLDTSCSMSTVAAVALLLVPTITIAQIRSLEVYMFVVAAFYGLLLVVCFLMSFGFKFFSNLPVAELDLDQMTWRVGFLGGLCKHGPWIARFVLVVAGSLVVGLLIRMAPARECFGVTARTHNCINFQDDSAITPSLSRYYFSEHCQGPGLPHQADMEAHLRECNSPAYKSMFSGRFDDTDVNRIRVVYDSSNVNFLYKASSQFEQTCPYYGIDIPGQKMFRDVYCRCLYVGESTTNEAALKRINNRIDRLNVPKIQGSAVSVLPCDDDIATTTVESCIPSNYRGQQPLSLLVKAKNPDDPYEAFRTNASFGYATKQFCAWGSSNDPTLFFDEPECSQIGSYINRYIYLFCLLMSILTFMLIGIGAMLRYAVPTETWCYNPHVDNENYLWKILRTIGPG
ncbi:hypothetical protein FOL46_006666 [Perkinsus olseni]|uniref:Uncharacterized protein n=1 Tax=Perkinsus olseni TaxID=32597 RepID=A0A7J6MQ28_PEROL|nr:hypothetical protein FOL46_006666 [Perkinsus olseni]